MATHSNILAWEVPCTEESGWLQSMGSQRVGYDLVTDHLTKLWGGEGSCFSHFDLANVSPSAGH